MDIQQHINEFEEAVKKCSYVNMQKGIFHVTCRNRAFTTDNEKDFIYKVKLYN